jgi:cyclic pyranopterin phosphate synthase
MIDKYGRNIDYLRLSVTDLCNLRCIYCMPEGGVEKLKHEDILSVEEIAEIAAAAASLGIKKIRLTGGEPLVRRGIDDILKIVSGTPGIEEVCLTTNGILLTEKIDAVKAAGVKRVNISIDSLDEDTYARITRGGSLSGTLAGIQTALDAGLTPVKVNAVLMGGINEESIKPLIELTKDNDLHIRFIEVMPVGECAGWNSGRFISADFILETDPGLKPCGNDGVSRIYRKPGHTGTVGLISPISNHFCPGCNKIRITADGKLKPCLHSVDEIHLMGLHGDELTEAIRRGILDKPLKHGLEGGAASNAARNMNAIGG